jgi:lysophospholipase L1-like esterase
MMKSTYKDRFIFLLILLITISNIACSKASNSSYTMPPQTTGTDSTAPITSTKFLALGDSYTIGQSVAESDRFPAQTVAALRKDSISIDDPQYIATTGWTTIDLQNAIAQQNPQGPYEAVTLLIGVNDQYQGLDTGGYRTRFTQLLQKAIQLAGNRINRVFVLSIPDYSVTPFGGGSARIKEQIDAFNAINQQITIDNKVAYINITDISRRAATDQTLTADDGLHPSGKQYALWVQVLAPAMAAALK